MTGLTAENPAATLLARLGAACWSLGAAESLTGGLLADRIVQVPGASATFRGSVVSYATDVKRDLLGVDAGLLAAHGPVHPLVAAQMAAGAAQLLGTDLTLATTGVAGPAGQDGQGVGTIYLACAHPGGVWVRHYRLAGGREQLRASSVDLALALGAAAIRPTGNKQDAPGR
ncbi:CinA family protein [Pseudactinotalea sp. Z1732]|uniref:CinA family protein n=1 Tax=Micrococcales TaxID=85006 RepID=UPI003C7D5FD4